MSSIVLGLCIGYALAFALGMVDMSAASAQSLFGVNVPLPFKYGLDFHFSSFLALGLVYLITAIEATGDITANSMISGKPIQGAAYLKRVSGGVLADGFNSFIAGALNSFPNSIFAQNNGIIQLTGVASRYVGYYIAALLLLLGLFPIVGVVFSLMPDPSAGRSNLVDVRDGSCRRYPHHCGAEDRPQGDVGPGGQHFVWLGRRDDARYFK